jgi:transcription elongation factor GreB
VKVVTVVTMVPVVPAVTVVTVASMATAVKCVMLHCALCSLPAPQSARTYRYNASMNKAFVKDSSDDDDDADVPLPEIPAGAKNYITPAGYQRLKDELLQLIDVDRPEVVRIVHWAASNGDRSENGDYIYGKRRLREIDRRIRFLTKRMDLAAVVDPSAHHGSDQVFFGATVTYRNHDGLTHTITILGIDELDPLHGRISWIAPVARALTKAREGDVVSLQTPAGTEELEILSVQYPAPAPSA